MRLDWNCIREILLFEEKHQPSRFPSPMWSSSECPLNEVEEYYRLLAEVGYLRKTGSLGCLWQMTVKGHELLTMLRDPERWEIIKVNAERLGIELSPEVIRRLFLRSLNL